jgi:hypothetical protein
MNIRVKMNESSKHMTCLVSICKQVHTEFFAEFINQLLTLQNIFWHWHRLLSISGSLSFFEFFFFFPSFLPSELGGKPLRERQSPLPPSLLASVTIMLPVCAEVVDAGVVDAGVVNAGVVNFG